MGLVAALGMMNQLVFTTATLPSIRLQQRQDFLYFLYVHKTLSFFSEIKIDPISNANDVGLLLLANAC